MGKNQNFGITVQALLDANAGQALQDSLNKIGNLKIKVDVDSNIKNNVSKSLSSTEKDISNYKKSLEATEQSTKNVGNAFSSLINNIGKVALWGVATNAIYGTKKSIDEMFKSIVEIESRLVELERVSTGIDVQKVFDGAYEASQRFGAGLYDTLDAVNEIARSYNYLDEAQIVATASAAVLATTISDLNGDEAVKTIIAVSNAYNLLIENSELLIDMINEVDNNFSVSSQVISDALRKSSATSNAFGVALEKQIGYITAISATTQESGQVIGNSLKTILSRITTLGESEAAFDGIGLSIRDMSGEMKSSSEILDELSGKWKFLSEEQQQNLGVTVAGRFQLTRFLALMDNYDMALDATTSALNSQGSASRENVIYLNSYQAKIERLENAQLALAKAVGDSSAEGLGKTYLETKTIITEVTAAILKFSDVTIILASSLISLGVALSKTVNGKKILAQISGLLLTQEQQEANMALKMAQNRNKEELATKGLVRGLNLKALAIEKAKASTEQYNIATMKSIKAQNLLEFANKQREKGNLRLADISDNIASKYQQEAAEATGLAIKYKALGIAAQVAGFMIQAAFTLGIGIIIGAITNKILGLINANKELEQSALESGQEMATWSSELKNNVKNITEYRDALEKTNITTEEASIYKEDLLKIQKELIDRYGKEAEGLDLVNGNMKKNIETLDELNRKKAEETKLEMGSAARKAEKNLAKKKVDTIGVFDYEAKGALSKSAEKLGVDFGMSKDFISFGGTRENLIKDYEKIYKDLEENGKKIYSLSNSQLDKLLGDISKKIKKHKSGISGSLIISDDYKQVELEAREDYVKFKQDIREASVDGELSGTDIEAILNSYDGLEGAFKKSGKSLKDLINDYQLLPPVIDETNNGFGRYIQSQYILNTETEKLSKNINDMQNAYNLVSSAMDEYNENGFISIDTMESLLKLDERYLNMLFDKNGNLHLNEQAYKDLAMAQLAEARAKIFNTAMTALDTLEKNKNRDEVDALISKYGNLSTKLGEVTSGYAEVAKKAAAARTAQGIEGIDILVDNILKTMDTQLKLYDVTVAGINKSLSKSMGGTSSKSNQKTYFDFVNERLEKFKNNLDSLDLELSITQEKFKLLAEGTQAWTDNLKKQEQIILSRQRVTSDYINAIERELRSNKLTADDRVKLNNLLQQQTLEYNKQNTALQELAKTEQDYYKNEIKKKIDLVKELENSRHKDVIENIKKEREAFKKAVDNQISLMKKAEDARQFDKTLENLQKEKQTIETQISRLQGDDSRLANTKRIELAEELAKIEDEIMENQIDRQNELREDNLNTILDKKNEELNAYEEVENKKNEIILNNLQSRADVLDNLNLSLYDLNNQLSSLANILNTFPSWADSFNAMSGVGSLNTLIGGIPTNNTGANTNNNSTNTFVINVTASGAKEGQEAGKAIVDELIKNGIITSGNGF